jgi:hypothetical protein
VRIACVVAFAAAAATDSVDDSQGEGKVERERYI